MRRFGLKRHALAVITAVLACVVAGPLVAGAAGGDRGHHGDGVAITWTRAPKPGAAFTPGMRLCVGDTNQCVLPLQGLSALFSGDLVGEALNSTVFAPLIEGAPGGGSAAWVATVTESPCGTGTIVLLTMAWASGDPTAPGAGKWQIVPDAGTGDLQHVHGSGRTTIAPDLSTAEYRGHIFCNASPTT